jgi:hypothetical protein
LHASDGDGTGASVPVRKRTIVRQGLAAQGTVAGVPTQTFDECLGAAFQSCSISVTTIPRSVISMEPSG